MTKRLRLGQPTAAEPEKAAPEPVNILEDAAIDSVSLKELRSSYRELRALHQGHSCEEVIAQRTKEALQRTRDGGKKTGGHVPLGYNAGDDRVLHADKRERQIMKIAKQQRAQGKSLRKIATHLAGLGFFARNEQKFQAAQIKRLVERVLNDETK